MIYLTVCSLITAYLCYFAVSKHIYPTFDESLMKNITALQGDDVVFRCKVNNLGKHLVAFARVNYRTNLISTEDKVFIRRDKYEVTVKPETDERILHIKHVDEYDAGGYLCQVNTEPVISKIGFLQLKAPPKVSKTSSIIEVHEGHNVTLQCNADGSPPPAVIWRRQDRQLIRFNGATGYGTTIYNGSMLTISRVSRKHMAEYICTASNGIPPDAIFNVRLHVLFKPNVKAKTRAISVPYGGQVNLVCIVEAWPSADVLWSKNGGEIFDSDKFAIAVDRKDKYFSIHTLTVKRVSSDEYGTYRCSAKNDIGKADDDVAVKEYSFPEVASPAEEERYSVIQSSTENDSEEEEMDQLNDDDSGSKMIDNEEESDVIFASAAYEKMTPLPAKRRDLVFTQEPGAATKSWSSSILLLILVTLILRQ